MLPGCPVSIWKWAYCTFYYLGCFFAITVSYVFRIKVTAFFRMEVIYLRYLLVMHGLLLLARCKWVFGKRDLCSLQAQWRAEDKISWRDPYQDVSPLIPVWGLGASYLVLWRPWYDLVRKELKRATGQWGWTDGNKMTNYNTKNTCFNKNYNR